MTTYYLLGSHAAAEQWCEEHGKDYTDNRRIVVIASHADVRKLRGRNQHPYDEIVYLYDAADITDLSYIERDLRMMRKPG